MDAGAGRGLAVRDKKTLHWRVFPAQSAAMPKELRPKRYRRAASHPRLDEKRPPEGAVGALPGRLDRRCGRMPAAARCECQCFRQSQSRGGVRCLITSS